MNNDSSPAQSPPENSIPASDPAPRGESNLWSSSIYRLCEEVIALREMNNRQHKLFEQALARSRDAMQASFNSFAADTQRAYQQLRQEIHGEKRASLALLNELLDLGCDLDHIVGSRPDDPAGLARWADAVEVQARKLQAALRRHGIHPYDAVIGSAYDPRLHERVGSRPMDGMDPQRVAEQRVPGYASQQPGFVLRRAKVIVSE